MKLMMILFHFMYVHMYEHMYTYICGHIELETIRVYGTSFED